MIDIFAIKYADDFIKKLNSGIVECKEIVGVIYILTSEINRLNKLIEHAKSELREIKNYEM